MPAPHSRHNAIPLVAALWLASVLGAWWYGAQSSPKPARPPAPTNALTVGSPPIEPDPTLSLQGWPGIPRGGLRRAQETERTLTSLAALLPGLPAVRREREYLELLEKLEPEDMPRLNDELRAVEARGQDLPWERVMF